MRKLIINNNKAKCRLEKEKERHKAEMLKRAAEQTLTSRMGIVTTVGRAYGQWEGEQSRQYLAELHSRQTPTFPLTQFVSRQKDEKAIK